MALVECIIMTKSPKDILFNLKNICNVLDDGNLQSQLAQVKKTFSHAMVQKDDKTSHSNYVFCLLTQELFDHLQSSSSQMASLRMTLHKYDFSKTPGPSAQEKPHLVVYLQHLATFRERGWLYARVENFLKSLTKLGYLSGAKVYAHRNSGGEVNEGFLKVFFNEADSENKRRFVSALFNNMSFFTPYDIPADGSRFLLSRIKNSWLRDNRVVAAPSTSHEEEEVEEDDE